MAVFTKDSSETLNQDFNDTRALIEQFHAALALGPVVIFIDGMSELVSKVKLNEFLPNETNIKFANYNYKFVLTLRKSSDNYTELVSHKNCKTQDLVAFSSDLDYINFFFKHLNSEEKLSSTSTFIVPTSSYNVLYNKFLRYINELKNSRHGKNPLYLQLIAQELFTFDKYVYPSHPIYAYSSKSPTASQVFASNETGSNKKLSQATSVDQKPVPSLLTRSLLMKNQGPDQARVGAQMMGSTTTLHSQAKSMAAETASLKSHDNESAKSEAISGEHQNLVDLYIEEVSTLREIVQKIFSRYIVKKGNWSTNASQPLSTGKISQRLIIPVQ